MWLCFSKLLRSPQAAQSGVKNRFEMLIYLGVNSAFSPIFALSCARLRTSQRLAGKSLLVSEKS